MNLFKKNKILVTHNGTFHADDIFACATLSLYLKNNVKIIRTRDPKIIEKGDFVFDVGGVYDPSRNRFDHHQKGGAGERENGIPYAAFGLVWKSFGKDLCGGDARVQNLIDKKIVCHIDCVDNGIDFFNLKFKDAFPYTGDQNFLIFSPTWKEKNLDGDVIFIKQVEEAKKFLLRQIEVAKTDIEGAKIIKEDYEKSEDKRIVILRDGFPRYLYQKTLSVLPEPIYMIMPSDSSTHWKVEAVVKNPDTLESRKPFPESWRGRLNGDKELQNLSSVKDADFCHKAGFLATAKSKEGAVALAQKALES